MDFRPALSSGRRRSMRPLRALMLGIAALVSAAVAGVWAFERMVQVPVPEAPGGPSDGQPSGDPPAVTVTGERLRVVLPGGQGSLERLGATGGSGALTVVRVGGDPYAVGHARGRLLEDLLGGLDRLLALRLLPAPAVRPWSGFLRTPLSQATVRWQHRDLPRGLDDEARLELRGVADGAGLPGRGGLTGYERLVYAQSLPDAAARVGRAPGLQSVVFALVGQNGHLYVGRSVDVAGAGGQQDPAEAWREAREALSLALDRARVLSFVRRAGRLAFAEMGWPGQAGTLTGVNEAGLMVAVGFAKADEEGLPGTPASLLARRLLETAKKPEDAVAYLKRHPPVQPASFFLAFAPPGDTSGSQAQALVVEAMPHGQVGIRKGLPLWATDHFASAPYEKDAENDRIRRLTPSGARAKRLEELVGGGAARGKTEVVRVLQVLRDRRGPGDKALPLGHVSAVDPLGLGHAVVIDLTARRLWAVSPPGRLGAAHAFDLTAELGGGQGPAVAEDPEAAAVAILPGDSVIIDPDYARLLQARRELAAAQRWLERGHQGRATDCVTRAQALCPELPGPYRLLGDLAQRRGDHATAEKHWRKYLSLEPGDRDRAEAIRARLGEL
jgi:hypothetical protein